MVLESLTLNIYAKSPQQHTERITGLVALNQDISSAALDEQYWVRQGFIAIQSI